MDELIGKLWARRHELTDDEWREASPILLGYAVALLAERDGQEDVRKEIEMIRMGADYTGLAAKTHAWVSMDLLKRVDEALDHRDVIKGAKK